MNDRRSMEGKNENNYSADQKRIGINMAKPCRFIWGT